jgi:hypothetical protein
MASVPVSINGVLWDHTTKTGRPVTIVGEGYLTGVGVGGGPMPGGPPLGMWGPITEYPDAGFPGPQPGQPPHIWGGPYFPPYATTGPGFPTNPIVIPRPPVDFPTPPAEGNKPPPEGGGWGYSSEYGWGYFPMHGGKPQPGGPGGPTMPPATP